MRRELALGHAVEALRMLDHLDQGSGPRVLLLRAQALLALERPGEAAEILDDAGRWPSETGAGLRLRARALAASGDLEGMRATTEALRGRAAGRARRLAEVWLFEGNLEASVENEGRAIRAYERAQRLDPEVGALLRLGRLAESMGDVGRAYRAYAELCRNAGMTGPHCEDRDRLRRAGFREPPGASLQLPVTP